MAILDVFKKKSEQEKSVEKKKNQPKEGIKPKRKVKPKAKTALKTEAVGMEGEQRLEIKPKVKVAGLAYKFLKKPRITEKATFLAEKNQYVFEVWPSANKTEIKKSIENTYGVNVEGVRIIRVPKKPRRLGKIQGFRAGYKKAIVQVKQGQKIEVLPR